MRLAVVSDIHCTERPSKSDVSLEEQAKILAMIRGDIAAAGPDVVLLGGDLYDGKSTSAERRVVWDFCKSCTVFFRVVVIRGNHDDPLDIEALNHIPGVEAVTAPRVIITSESREGKTISIGCIPWPTVKPENGAALLADIVRGMVAERPDFILGHLDLVGAKLDGGQESTGKVDSVLTVDDFGGIPTALGHYHKRNGLYTGSIRQMKFGDDAAKGFGIYDTDAKSWEWFGPYGRRLLCFDVKWKNGEMENCFVEIPTKSDGLPELIRLRYEVAESDREVARKDAEAWAHGIRRDTGREVVIEPTVIADTRTRGAEVAAAVTMPEKLEAYWGESRPARADEILRKMEALK